MSDQAPRKSATWGQPTPEERAKFATPASTPSELTPERRAQLKSEVTHNLGVILVVVGGLLLIGMLVLKAL